MIIVMRLPKRNKNLKGNSMKQIKVSTRIILLFSAIILLSFIGDYNHAFFGDWLCSGSGARVEGYYYYKGCNYAGWDFHGSTWHYGYRHWIFILMGICLSTIQAISIIKLINKKD